MIKQIITISISCDEDCPNKIPETCLFCKKHTSNKKNVDIIEVLDDWRHKDELPEADDEEE